MSTKVNTLLNAILISLLLLVVVVFLSEAFAQTDPEFNYGELAKNINAFISAPTWKAVMSMFGIFGMCFLSITKYFWDKNKRERDAYEYALKVRKEQELLLARTQRDSTDALIENIETTYRQDFEYYAKKITSKEYKAVFLKIPSMFHEKVSSFLYKEDLSPAARAVLIIECVRKK